MGKLSLVSVLIAICLALSPGSSASAASTFGSSLAVAPEKSNCGTGTFTNTALASSTAAPFAGVIVRWRMDLAETGGVNTYRLRVLRPAGGTKYTAVGTSPAQTAPLVGVNVLELPVPLPVQAGDIIAIDCPNGAPIPSTDSGSPGSIYAYFSPVLGEGKTASTSNQLPGEEMLINADVVGAPTIASISPSSGPAGGGTTVTFTGSHLGDVSAVTFGGVLASFTLGSEGQLVAVAPAGSASTPASVVVTNAAGSASAPQPFAYAGVTQVQNPTAVPAGLHCVVPSLRGKKLKTVRDAVRKSHCRLGKVTKLRGATAATGRVGRQGPKAGKKLPAGAKVSVTILPVR